MTLGLLEVGLLAVEEIKKKKSKRNPTKRMKSWVVQRHVRGILPFRDFIGQSSLNSLIHLSLPKQTLMQRVDLAPGRQNKHRQGKQTTALETPKRPNCWCLPAFTTWDYAANRTEAMMGFEYPVWPMAIVLSCH